jgi:Glycosyltransferase family 17
MFGRAAVKLHSFFGRQRRTVDLRSLPQRSSRRRVICGCLIHRELDILDWRVHELGDVVDDFVVVEATRTFAGQPRQLLHPNRDPRLVEFAGRLHCTVVDDLPDETDLWTREWHQREAIWTRGAATLHPADDTLVIISDVDEVPFPEVVERLAWSDFEPPLLIRAHWFNFNWDCYLGPWEHASIRVYTAGFLKNLVSAGQGIKIGQGSCRGTELRGLNGWHASWFGTNDDILDKLASYCHALDPRNREIVTGGVEAVRRRRASGRDIFGDRPALDATPRLPVHAGRALGNTQPRAELPQQGPRPGPG